jgi:hypothetical protein
MLHRLYLTFSEFYIEVLMGQLSKLQALFVKLCSNFVKTPRHSMIVAVESQYHDAHKLNSVYLVTKYRCYRITSIIIIISSYGLNISVAALMWLRMNKCTSLWKDIDVAISNFTNGLNKSGIKLAFILSSTQDLNKLGSPMWTNNLC